DHIRIQRALHEELRVTAGIQCGLFEHADEHFTDAAPLLLGVLDTGESVEELLACIDHDQMRTEVTAERALDALALALTQQTVVDEDARELIADRTIHECRCNR